MTGMPRIGFIGLGHMGHGMAVNILSHGYSLTVLAHRKREAVEDLVRRGAVEASHPAEVAARSDIVVLCVPGAAEVEAIVDGTDGLQAGARPGLAIIDCTTSDPTTLLGLSDRYADRDIVFIDAPLGRSPREAWKGSLSTMVGCDPATLERIRPVLASFATTIQHAGPLGAGHRLKLVNNFVSLGYAALYSEALALALKAGLTTTAFDELMRSSRMHCAFYDTFIGWALSGDSDSHRFALDEALRTISDVVAFSRSVRFTGGLAASVRNVYQKAVDGGLGEAMLPELPRSIAEANDIELTPARGAATR